MGPRLLAAGLVALVVALAALFAPVHAGDHDCGAVASPGPDSGATDCKDYQRVLLLGGGVALVVGVGLLGAGWHRRRPPGDEEEVAPE